MERNITPAPKAEILERWFEYLKLTADEKQNLLDLGAVSRREIPRDIATDEVVLEALPVFFRAARGAEMDKEKLTKFVEQVRKLHTADT